MKKLLTQKTIIFLPMATAFAAAVSVSISTQPPALDGKWSTQKVSAFFWAEGASVADVNNDGHLDVLSGPYWYAGPEFKEYHLIYEANESFKTQGEDGAEVTHPGFEGGLGTKNSYSRNFVSFSYDINGDGWNDYMVVGMPGEETFWYENPGESAKDGEAWKRHLVLAVTDNESPMLVDVDGDGVLDLLCMSEGRIGFASPDASDAYQPWIWKGITPENRDAYQRYTHGIGLGDINGDGRLDVLEKGGWWEQPADWDGKSEWVKHEVAFSIGERGGAQMYGYDVNGDGRTDVITSLDAHGYGVVWFEQKEDGSWDPHYLVGTPDHEGSTGVVFTQHHAIELADLDGDGLLDIVTGKRFWAHGPDGDPEASAAPVLYAFMLKRENGEVRYEPQIIHDRSGVGTQFTVVDINGDGKLDVVTGNKLGVYVHTQN